MQLAVSTSQNHTMLRRRKNVWYSVCDGNWEDPNTWLSNALDKKNHTYPQLGDDVHISHTVDYNNTLTTSYLYNFTIGNLYIYHNGELTASRAGNQQKLIVNGGLYCDGTIDFSTAASPMALWLNTHINYCNNFLSGTQSNVLYNSNMDHFIMPLTYYNLEITNTGTKTLSADLTVTNQLNIDAGILELGTFDANLKHINATIGKLSKNSGGTINITGSVVFGAGSNGSIVFSGNPTVNFSGTGISGSDTRYGTNFGTNVNITTSQTWAFTTGGNVISSIGSGTFLIGSGVTLSIGSTGGVGSNAGGWLNMGTVNGVDGTSTLNIDGSYGYGNTNPVMATGVLNLNHSGNSKIVINAGVTMNLPQTSFYDLEVDGSATTIGNTTVSHTLVVSGTLELSTYDFAVSNTTTYGGTISKSGNGTVNFAALVVSTSSGKINFTGSPTVNLSGNWSGDIRAGVNFGSNPVNIIQSVIFALNGASNVTPLIAASFTIASGKTLTNNGVGATLGGLSISGTITGVDATSIFDNRSVFTYQNVTAPMATGKLYCNQAANTVIYSLAGNQDITVPSDATPGYQNLTLQGSGAKRLLGNVSVKGVYMLIGPATLYTNGFALTNP
ncbi:MAG: hypothetical protein JST50_01370 [Bacteroidetes bacterium]|jgi:hypothetical protein|nr:hypothetical protein [Bacteroidota bacterium]